MKCSCPTVEDLAAAGLEEVELEPCAAHEPEALAGFIARKQAEAGSRQAQELRETAIHSRMLGREEARREAAETAKVQSTGDPLLDQLCDAVGAARPEPISNPALPLNASDRDIAAAIGLPADAA